MTLRVLGNAAFLPLQDAHQHIVGQTPQAFILYLRNKYITITQTREETTPLYAKMRPPFSMNTMIEKYFAQRQRHWYKLGQVCHVIDADETILLCIVQFKKNEGFIKTCEDWDEIVGHLLSCEVVGRLSKIKVKIILINQQY